MFAYWLLMNMNTHGFDMVKLGYNVNDKTNIIWDSLSRREKERAVMNSIVEEILGTGSA